MLTAAFAPSTVPIRNGEEEQEARGSPDLALALLLALDLCLRLELLLDLDLSLDLLLDLDLSLSLRLTAVASSDLLCPAPSPRSLPRRPGRILRALLPRQAPGGAVP